MASFSIDEFCADASQAQPTSDAVIGGLATSSQAFLQALGLPTLHPFCTLDENYYLDGIPPQGPLNSDYYWNDQTYWENVKMLFFRVAPPLLAMAELWLRLFASILAPLGILHLLYGAYILPPPEWKTVKKMDGHYYKIPCDSPQKTLLSCSCVIGLSSCVVLTTDTLYNLEWGNSLWMFGLCFLLNLQNSYKHYLAPRIQFATMAITIALGLIVLDLITGEPSFGNKVDICKLKEGVYWDSQNEVATNIVRNWPRKYRTYQYNLSDPDNAATRWMPTGDSRTGLPFLLNSVEPPQWTRVWLPVVDAPVYDGAEPSGLTEVLALDIRFPTSGHDPTLPVYLILHGLSGGSHEGYVKDFAWRHSSHTVVVMIARGLMNLPIRGWNTFHGARTSDVNAAAKAVKRAMQQLDGGGSTAPLLAGVGYSMGGIVLANHVARSGQDCALDVAVSISGGLDTRYQEHFDRAQRLWQPILTQELRETFLLGKWGERTRKRLSPQTMKGMLNAYHITDIDKTAIVGYNRFRDLNHYYTEMSPLGDIPLAAYNRTNATAFNSDEHVQARASARIQQVSIPLLIVHALDDPLISWRTVAANEGWLHPKNLVHSAASGNLFMLLTKRGGHVGWPLGWLPYEHKWKWMNEAASSFVQAVIAAKAAPVRREERDEAARDVPEMEPHAKEKQEEANGKESQTAHVQEEEVEIGANGDLLRRQRREVVHVDAVEMSDEAPTTDDDSRQQDEPVDQEEDAGEGVTAATGTVEEASA